MHQIALGRDHFLWCQGDNPVTDVAWETVWHHPRSPKTATLPSLGDVDPVSFYGWQGLLDGSQLIGFSVTDSATAEALLSSLEATWACWLSPSSPEASVRWLYAEAPTEAAAREELWERVQAKGMAQSLTQAWAQETHAKVQAADGSPGLLWEWGRQNCRLWRVSPAGVQPLAVVAGGWKYLGAEIKEKLGLRFPTAAEKLFLDAAYDFSSLGAELLSPLSAAVRADLTLEEPPVWTRVVGIHPNLRWLEDGLAQLDWGTAWQNLYGENVATSPLGLPATATGLSLDPAARLTPAQALEGLAKVVAPAAPKPQKASIATPVSAAVPTQPPSPPAVATNGKALEHGQKAAVVIEAPVRTVAPVSLPADDTPQLEPPVRAMQPAQPATAKPPVEAAAPKPPPPSAPTPTATPAPEAKKGLPVWLWPALGGAVVAVLAWFFWPQGDSAPPAPTPVVSAPAPAATPSPAPVTPPTASPPVETPTPVVVEAVSASPEPTPAPLESDVALPEALPEETAPVLVEAVVPEPEPEPVPLPDPTGSVRVRSEPSGAVVRRGEEELGRTPLTLDALPLGPMELHLDMPGYASTTLTLEVVEGEMMIPATSVLAPLPGELVVTSEPEGIAFVVTPSGQSDDILAEGVTPMTIEDLAPSFYAVRLDYAARGWPARVARARVRSAQSADVNARFAGGTLRVEAEPVAAEVLFDGEVMGTTPLELTHLYPGTREITFRAEGYEDITRSVRIQADRETTETATLLSLDRVFTAREIDQAPSIAETDFRLEDVRLRSRATFNVAFVLEKNGKPTDIRFIESSRPDLEERVAALLRAQQFDPAMRAGQPVRLATRVQLNLEPSSGGF